MKNMLNKHWWEIFQRSPHKQKKPYILYYTLPLARRNLVTMEWQDTQQIYENIKAQKSQKCVGSPTHMSSHLFGKDLGNYQFNLVEKKREGKKKQQPRRYMTCLQTKN